MEIVYLECAPVEEECVSVGTENYEKRARHECNVWIRQLERTFPIPEDLAEAGQCFYKIQTKPHDLGTYLEVVLKYNPNKDVAIDYANQVEEKCPTRWDDTAREELKSFDPAHDLEER